MLLKYLQKVIVIILAACVFLIGGCSVRRKVVLYTIFPIGYMLEQIAGNTLTVQSVQDKTHLYDANITENFASSLKHAKSLMYIQGLEPYLIPYEKDIAQSQINTVDLSINSAIYDTGKLKTDEEGNETTLPYYQDPAFASIDTNVKELHFYLDPIEMISMGKEITEALSAYYPDSASYYNNNMHSLSTRLITLDGKYQSFATQLTKEGKTLRFASLKDNFGVWQNTYGFEIYPIILSKYGILPNSAQLEIIKATLQSENVEYIVYDDKINDEEEKLLDLLVNELGLMKINIHDITSASLNNQDDYFAMMEDNLRVLQLMSQE